MDGSAVFTVRNYHMFTRRYSSNRIWYMIHVFVHQNWPYILTLLLYRTSPLGTKRDWQFSRFALYYKELAQAGCQRDWLNTAINVAVVAEMHCKKCRQKRGDAEMKMPSARARARPTDLEKRMLNAETAFIVSWHCKRHLSRGLGEWFSPDLVLLIEGSEIGLLKLCSSFRYIQCHVN